MAEKANKKEPAAKSNEKASARKGPRLGIERDPTESKALSPVAAVSLAFAILYLPFLVKYGYTILGQEFFDLPSFFCAAQAAFRYHASPYDLQFLQSLHHQRVYPFLYPPPSLLFFWPLCLMTYQQASTAMLVFNHGLVLCLAYLLTRLLGLSVRRHALPLTILLLYVLLFNPIVWTLVNGQINLLVACLLVLAWLNTRGQRPAIAGLCLGCAVLLKTYPAVIILLLLAARRYRTVAYTLLFVGLGTFAALVLVPWTIWSDWLTHMLPYGGYGRTIPGLFPPESIFNLSLNGMLARLFNQGEWCTPIVVKPWLGTALAYLLALGAVGASLDATWHRVHKDAGTAGDWAFLIALPLIFLVAPLSWEHHLTFVLPSIAVLLIWAIQSGANRAPLSRVTLLVAATILSSPLGTQALWQVKGVALLLIWAVIIRLAFQEEPALFGGEQGSGVFLDKIGKPKDSRPLSRP